MRWKTPIFPGKNKITFNVLPFKMGNSELINELHFSPIYCKKTQMVYFGISLVAHNYFFRQKKETSLSQKILIKLLPRIPILKSLQN